jgi:hypothetical protein
MFAHIAYRLSTNGAVAKELVESLKNQYPGATIHGGASYERESITITVVDGIDKKSRPELERWLRQEKNERKISPEIWLRFPSGEDFETLIE